MLVFNRKRVSTNAYLFKSLINHIGMLEMVVGEEIKLIQEISNVNATERIHLRKR